MRNIDSAIGGVFLAVSDIEAASHWYCDLLQRPFTGDILFGHLYVLSMRTGPALVLDSKDYNGPQMNKAAFHFNTKDLAGAHAHALAIGAGDVSPIRDHAFFTFKDPDGNLLMVADVPAAAPFRGDEEF